MLSDPVQRYILADEVGLGKTIEAGVLIRQHLIDHPWDHDVAIVVPPHLVERWRQELATKLFVTETEQVHLISESDLPDGNSLRVSAYWLSRRSASNSSVSVSIIRPKPPHLFDHLVNGAAVP